MNCGARTIHIPFYNVHSIRRTYTGLFEVTVVEPRINRNTIDKLLFYTNENSLVGDIGLPGLKDDVGPQGVKGDIGLPGLK